jgi:hypothetical protein
MKWYSRKERFKELIEIERMKEKSRQDAILREKQKEIKKPDPI